MSSIEQFNNAENSLDLTSDFNSHQSSVIQTVPIGSTAHDDIEIHFRLFLTENLVPSILPHSPIPLSALLLFPLNTLPSFPSPLLRL